MKNLFTYITVFFLAYVLFAQDINVPVNIQIPIIVKILAFNRTITDSPNPNIVITVLYQSKFKQSKQVKDAVIEAIAANHSSSRKKIIVKEVDINSVSDISNSINSTKPDVFILTPLRAIDIEQVSNIAKKNKILSISLCPTHLRDKISVAIDLLGDKPQILINLTSSKLEGADFSSQLLKLSKILN